MFASFSRNLAAAALVAAVSTHAASAGQSQMTSSSVWWSPTGDHADLVIRYSSLAKIPLTIRAYVLDAGGFDVSEALQTCGTGIKSGDSITSYQLAPGQYCWIRAYRGAQQDEMVGKALLSDVTNGTANARQFVRGSLEIRDASDNVLTHVEVY